MKRFPVFLGLISLTCFTGQAISAQGFTSQPLSRDWRITRVVPAPWVDARAAQDSSKVWLGVTVQFDANSVDGPGLLHCDHVKMEKTRYSAEALFQGSLPTPPDTAIQQLGIAQSPLAGVRLTCSSGTFEFHFVDSETLLLALDNQILTLSRSPGTLATAMSPEGRMQRFLESHFNNEMGFTREAEKNASLWLSKRLDGALKAYFDKPNLADEVPAIDGDPFTDSQSYPTRFVVGKAKTSGDRAEIPVRFSDAFGAREILYTLVHVDEVWQLDDVRYANGEMLSNLAE